LPSLLRNCHREVRAVGGVQKAAGDVLEIVRRGLLPRAKIAGALARHVLEGATEGAEAAPPCFKSDVRDRQVRVAKHRGRALDSASEQVAMWRYAERVL